MDFQSAAAVEMVAWQLRLSDWPRAVNRAKLNELYNGSPPYTEEEERQNRITTNVNFLEGTKILHDARRQFATAFTSQNQIFTVGLDYGPAWKKREWQDFITNRMNQLIRKSRQYLDTRDSTFAQLVLHGIGPCAWENRENWCPEAIGIEDVLVPSNTLTSLKNLPFFVIYRQYTGYELYKMTHGPKRDPAWNMALVDRCISWVDEQARQLNGTNWPETWSPEKMAERIKQDGGLYASDAVPTVDVLDLFFWSDEGKNSGWRRRMVLDAWGSPGVGGVGGIAPSGNDKGRLPDRNFLGTRNEFLYNPGKRKYADKIDEIIHFQFGDCSCVAPFRYHSVRALGFLLYAVCQLQNRLRCKFNDSAFEACLQYFRCTNPADQERLTKVDLVNMGVVPEGLEFVKAGDRWQVPVAVIEQLMTLNRQSMADNSASFAQDFDFDRENTQETATRTMAKVNASAALIGSMLQKAYNQQEFQYQEIARRFGNKQSRDADVRKFWVDCLKFGIPEEALNPARWNVQAVRVIGSGNKMLQVAMADKLMAIRPTLDPNGQKAVDRIYIIANSDDPALAEQLVPLQKEMSSTVHDAQLAIGTILTGGMVTPKEGMNHAEYVETWLFTLANLVKKAEMNRGMATADDVLGMQNLIAHIGKQLQFLAQDKRAKPQVKKYSDELAQLANLVKGYAQRLQQQQAQAQAAGAGMDPKDAAKIKATLAVAQSKMQLGQQSHAEKTAQRQITFQQNLKQDQEKHRLEIEAQRIRTMEELHVNRLKAFHEAKDRAREDHHETGEKK